MSESEQSVSEIVDAAMVHVSRLATLPEISVRILSLVEDPDSSAEDLEVLVSSDAVLSARVLKVVNSAFYGMPSEVATIQQAIVMLGFGGLKSIVLAASLAKLFRGGSIDESFNAQDLWSHSAAVGAAAKLLADEIGMDGGEMFLTGLMHDVGIVVEIQASRTGFVEVIKARAENPPETFGETEARILGATHEDFGLGLARKWNFPPAMQAAVGNHHHPERAEGDARRIASLICVADHLAALAEIGYVGTVAGSPFPTDAAEFLGISESVLDNVRAALPETASQANVLGAE